MEFQKFADTYVVRLDKGEEIIASLQKLCETEQIALASVTGIGAADHAVVGLYDVGQRQYHKTECGAAPVSQNRTERPYGDCLPDGERDTERGGRVPSSAY